MYPIKMLKVHQGGYQNLAGFAGKTAVSWLQSQFFIFPDSFKNQFCKNQFRDDSTIIPSYFMVE